MENVVHTTCRIQNTLVVAHVANVKLQFGAGVAFTHVILFLLITTEDSDFGDICIQETFQDSIAKRSGSAGNQQFLAFKHGFSLLWHPALSRLEC
ncbi:hypothetical protein D3C80_1767990 [compost metagenome]